MLKYVINEANISYLEIQYLFLLSNIIWKLNSKPNRKQHHTELCKLELWNLSKYPCLKLF